MCNMIGQSTTKHKASPFFALHRGMIPLQPSNRVSLGIMRTVYVLVAIYRCLPIGPNGLSCMDRVRP